MAREQDKQRNRTRTRETVLLEMSVVSRLNTRSGYLVTEKRERGKLSWGPGEGAKDEKESSTSSAVTVTR